MIYIWRKLHS